MTSPDTNVSKPSQRRVVCAALRSPNSLILGPRHFDKTMHDQIKQGSIAIEVCEQGFIDQWGKFMNREEALAVAMAANQILIKTGGANSEELFSEDLY